MPPRLMLWVLVVLVIRAEGTGRRTVHRLVGGHINIAPEFDDAELLITSSAGGGRDSKKKNGEEGGEEKKTLSQQVADGKYGLIQKELFGKPLKKPGVLSYDNNPEVPKDNLDNLGGLSDNDIWLAENHLLVIKGGSYPNHDSFSDLTHPIWTPIDDYKAPSRQVKIPAHPKVPPPFPVQLYEDGPLQILGTNSTTTLNGTFSAAPYPISSPEGGGFFPAFPPSGPYPSNFTSGEAPFPIPPYPPGEFGPPFPPFPLNGSLPPFFASLPPGAAILPPPGNITDQYDEDDPSIYYPPPYSFYYQMDNSTQVPPGPLVPGIVLPPPPNFFAPLEKTRKKPTSTTKEPKTRPTRPPTTTTESTKQIRPTTTPLPPTSVNNKHHRVNPTDISNQQRHTTTQAPQRVVTIYPARYVPLQKNRTYIPPRNQDRRKKPPAVTVLKPVKPSTTSTPRPVYFYENNEVNGRPFKVYGPPSRHRTVISSTQIPLRAYFSTSNEIDTNSVTQAPDANYYNNPRGAISNSNSQNPKKSQYYFYEEEPVTNGVTTERAPKSEPYFNIPKEYYVPAKESNRPVFQQQQQQQPHHQQHQQQQHQQQQQQRPQQRQPKPQQPQQYYYVNQRPSRPPTSRYRFIETTKKPDTFSVHVARLKQQIHQYYTTPDPYGTYDTPRPQNSPKPVYQFSFQAANYQPPQDDFRASPADDQGGDQFRPNKYSVQIQPAIEVIPTNPPPIYQNTPAPVYYEKPTTKRPEIKYYSSPQPDEYDYEEVEIGNQKDRYVATPSPVSQYGFQATPNPIYQSYYTKQDEPFFDDITKKYFTIFGKKIPGVTTPISNVENTTPRSRPQKQNVQIEYAQSIGKEVSLQGDTLVNYVPERPRPNAQAEYLAGRPIQRQKYQLGYVPEQAGLHSDVNINYKNPRPPVHQGAEIVRAIPVKMLAPENKPGSYISYELPGDNGAHFYFLTPQLAQRRDQGAGFYYESPNAARVRRSDDAIHKDS